VLVLANEGRRFVSGGNNYEGICISKSVTLVKDYCTFAARSLDSLEASSATSRTSRWYDAALRNDLSSSARAVSKGRLARKSAYFLMAACPRNDVYNAIISRLPEC
jgi:hypothetical protein